MNSKQKMDTAVAVLKEKYPAAVCSLEYSGEPWRLLVMGRLSAQCTDARVNEVCSILFSKYKTSSKLASASLDDIERIIRPCGLFHVKASDIIAECRMLNEYYGGVLPDTMEELLKFPGVGRKIANLLLGDIYHKPVVVTDTHCIRICGRLGFYPESLKNPVAVEKLLSQLIEPREQNDFCHRLVLFGREVCVAKKPACDVCPLRSICSH